jgi:hypothetical protein
MIASPSQKVEEQRIDRSSERFEVSMSIRCVSILRHMVGVCLTLLTVLPVWAGETVVPMTPAAWETKVLPEPGSSVSPAEAATFSLASDEKLGSCLGLGPWRAGQWGIRGESRQRFANDVCTMRGYYRTEAPATFQATVGVLFYRQK